MLPLRMRSRLRCVRRKFLSNTKNRPQTGSLGLHKQSLPPQAFRLLVRAGGLSLYSREFYSPGIVAKQDLMHSYTLVIASSHLKVILVQSVHQGRILKKPEIYCSQEEKSILYKSEF